jgi:hypothetical protein
MRIKIQLTFCCIDKGLCVVHLVVGGVPLGLEPAWVRAARVILMLPVQAVRVAVALVWCPGTHLAQGLVVCDVCCEATHLVKGQIHLLEQSQILVQIV